MKRFNYCVAHHWEGENGSIGAYNYFGEVHFGSLTEAESLLAYVKGKSPDKDWQIFKVEPYDNRTTKETGAQRA